MMIRSNRLTGLAAVAAVVASAFAHADRARAAEPMAVVAFSGYDALMKDIDFIGELAGQMQASQQVEMMVGMFTQNKGLAGLDKSKPIGVILQSNSGMPEPLICVPVTDSDELLGVAKQFGVTTEDLGDGVMQIQSPGMPLFGKPSGGWLLLSITPSAFDGAPADPGADLAKLTDAYDLAARAYVQNIPEAYRQQFVQLITQAANQSMAQMPDESDEDYQARQEQLQAGLDEMQQAVDDMDQITIGLAVDEQNANVALEFTATAQPGTKLAAEMAKAQNATTNFAGFFEPDAAMMMTLSAEAASTDLSQMEQQLEAAKKQANKEIDNNDDLSDAGKEKVKAALSDILDAFVATAQSGKFDGGAVLNMGDNELTFVGGGAIAEPQKIDSALRQIVEVGQEESADDMPEVSWNAESYQGYSFHTFSKEIPAREEEARAVFGDALQFAVGIGEDSVYFALGRGWFEKVKSVIDASAANPGKSVPPMEMTFALGQIMDFAESVAEDDAKPILARIASMLDNEANGRDHVRIVARATEGGNGQVVRIEAEEGVLRSIALGAMAAQMQAAGR